MGLFENAISNSIPGQVGNGYLKPAAGGNQAPLSKLAPGQTFTGEVTDVVNKNVTIRLENGQTVHARLQEQMNFNIGERVTFQVKSNSGSLLEIRPVETGGEGVNSTAFRALEAAGLPVNDKTIEMLKSLMQEQMPIDKASLSHMYKLMLGHDGADPAALVQMAKLKLPVTEENIAQFQNYKNFQHQISEQVSTLSEELPKLLGEMAKEGGQASSFNGQLLSLLLPEGSEAANAFLNADDLNAPAAPEQNVADGTLNFSGLQAEEKALTQQTAVQTLQDELSGAVDGKNLQNPQGAAGNAASAGEAVGAGTSASNEAAGILDGVEDASRPFGELKGEPMLNEVLSHDERTQLLSQLRNQPLSEAQSQMISSGDVSVKDFLGAVSKFIEDGFKPDKLLSGKEYPKLLTRQLEENFLLKPQDVYEKENVSEYYSRIKSQTEQINNMLEAFGRGDGVAARAGAGISDNVDFMNQVNQLFTYVQLPLKLAEESAHGELYVFTNKKKLMQREGKISALLHLDLTALGSMDVYVELMDTKVSASFRMEDDDRINFLSSNIDRLCRRLEERGFQTTTDFRLKEENPDFVDDFLKREQPAAPMQRFSFDVRA